MKRLDNMHEKMKSNIDSLGNFLVGMFHYLGLFIIGGVVFWAGLKELMHIINTREASIDNVLLLFIYLELGAMVGIYFKTNHLPIRFLLYIGITAMTRHLISIITEHGDEENKIIFYCSGILLLCLSVLTVRFASYKFPSGRSEDTEIK